MTLAVLIAVLAVGLGAALMLVSANSPRVLGPLRTFAAVAALSVVALHLLPESLEALGPRAVVAFVLALIAPTLLHWLGERGAGGGGGHGHPSRGRQLELEFSYLGLVAHHVGDGGGIGAYSLLPGGALAHLDVIIALVAHTMPLVAVVALSYKTAFGTRAAALRVGGLALASVVGVVLTFVVPLERIEAANAWIGAVASGLLVHVVTHDLTSDPPETPRARLFDLVAVVVGGAVALLGDGHGLPLPDRAVLLRAALPLCLGLGAALLLNQASKRIPLEGGKAPGVFASAVVSVMRALLRPISSRAADRSENVAFTLAAPALGLDVLVLTMACFGVEFAALRFAGALVAPVIIALVVAVFPGAGPVAAPPDEHVAQAGSKVTGWLDHVSIAIVFGVVAAGVLGSSMAPGPLLDESATPLELSVVTVLALLSGVPALALVMPLWVLVLKGLSPGAAMIALLVAPVLGRGGLRALHSQLGVMKTAVAIGWFVALAWVLAFLQNRPGALARLFAGREALHPAFEVVSLAALAALGLLALWRVAAIGVRLWLAALTTRS